MGMSSDLAWGPVVTPFRHASETRVSSLKPGCIPQNVDRDTADTARKARRGNSIFKIPVLFMRAVFLWPENLTPTKGFVARFLLPVLTAQLAVGGVCFLLSGEFANFVSALTTVGDVCASSLCLAKLLLLYRAGPQLMRMRQHLQHSFVAIEAAAQPEASALNARCETRCSKISIRFALFYAPFSLSALALNVANAFAPPDERALNVAMPRAWMESSYSYWPLFLSTGGACFAFLFYSVAYDALFLSLCLHMSCKCEILKILLRNAGLQNRRATPTPTSERSAAFTVGAGLPTDRKDSKRYQFEYWNDDGSPFAADMVSTSRGQTAANLRDCVLYHHMVIRLRDETEAIFADVSLFQMAYLLLGLGIPALRLLHEKSFSLTDGTFLVFYASWNFSQLLFYCWFADMLAESSEEVSVAALAAVRPPWPLVDAPDTEVAVVTNLDRACSSALRLITLRAQRPLHLTAGKFAYLTLVLYLQIIRKSQSIYSYLIRLR